MVNCLAGLGAGIEGQLPWGKSARVGGCPGNLVATTQGKFVCIAGSHKYMTCTRLGLSAFCGGMEEGLIRSYPYLRSFWQLVVTREGEDIFFSAVANGKWPMFLYPCK